MRTVVRDLARDDRPGAARQTEPRHLTADELEVLLAKMSDTFRPVAAACASAGLRWRDLDLKAGTLTFAGQLGDTGARLDITKTAAPAATVPLLPVLRRELVEHRARQGAATSR